LQPSNQKVSKLLGEYIGAHYMGARAVARPETAFPANCIQGWDIGVLWGDLSSGTFRRTPEASKSGKIQELLTDAEGVRLGKNTEKSRNF